MNKLVVVSGVPGSGKSYFSNTLKKIKQTHVYIVSSDDIRKQIAGTQKDITHDELVWKIFYGLCKVYSEDKDGIVILDATNYSREKRIDNIKDIKPLFDRLILVSYDIDKSIVTNQNFQREFPIAPDVLERFFDIFEHPNELDEEFYDKVITVKNSDISKAIEAVINEK